MSIQTTDERHVALFDSVTGIAFGPVFEDVAEADAFQHWYTLRFETGRSTDRNTKALAMTVLRKAAFPEMKTIADEWRAFLMDHSEDVCPFDGDDVDEPGWTNAHDVSYGDYTEARPSRCTCECHEKKPAPIWDADYPDGSRIVSAAYFGGNASDYTDPKKGKVSR